jgi:drug/metabolite transporter (DMT)-like permease
VPLAALALVLGAALCHSAYNFLLKADPRRREMSLGALAVGALLLTPVLALHSLREVPAAVWPLVFLSAGFETAYFLCLAAAYDAGELSLVYPIARGTAPLLVAPIAMLWLGERPSALGLAGIALVAAGLAVSYAGSLRGWTLSSESRRAAGLAVLTGCMTAGYSLVNKRAVAVTPPMLYALCVFWVTTALIWGVVALSGRPVWPAGGGGVKRRTVAVGVLLLAGYLGVLGAISLAPVAYVVAAREVAIVVTAVVGALVLRESHSTGRIAGALTIFAGVILIALAR